MFIEKKIKQKASAQRRWDNTGLIHKAFNRWKSVTGNENNTDKDGKTEDKNEGKEKERIHGINIGAGSGQYRELIVTRT
eukprot:3201837-Pleurochrysis_carterae.AAC.2